MIECHVLTSQDQRPGLSELRVSGFGDHRARNPLGQAGRAKAMPALWAGMDGGRRAGSGRDFGVGVLKPEHIASARQTFDIKWPNVCRVVGFRGRKGGLSRDAIDEIEGEAGLILWRTCLRFADDPDPASRIDCAVIAFAAWQTLSRHRSTSPSPIGGACPDTLDSIAGPTRSIRTDGVRLTASDARMDHPHEVAVYETGVSTREAAEALGISRTLAYFHAPKFGAVKFGRSWRWPADVLERAAM